MIYGLLKPDSGSLEQGLDMERQAKQVKARSGAQLGSTSRLPALNAIEQIVLFGRLYGRNVSSDDALSLVDTVNLREKACEMPGNMSGGQQQQLALALLWSMISSS